MNPAQLLTFLDAAEKAERHLGYEAAADVIEELILALPPPLLCQGSKTRRIVEDALASDVMRLRSQSPTLEEEPTNGDLSDRPGADPGPNGPQESTGPMEDPTAREAGEDVRVEASDARGEGRAALTRGPKRVAPGHTARDAKGRGHRTAQGRR